MQRPDGAASPAQETPPQENPVLAAWDRATARVREAPLLHKGEAAERALGALSLVLADIYRRQVELEERLEAVEAGG